MIDLVCVTGVAAGIVLLGGAVLLWFENSTRGFLLGTAAVALGTSHLLLPWFRSAWHTALAAWMILTVLAVAVLWGNWPLAATAAAVSFSGLTLLQIAYRRLKPYLNGERDTTRMPEPSADGRCSYCARLAPSAIAPLWCVSLLFMTSVTTGRPKYLCTLHARLNAIPATVFSLFFGWWGLPWGFVRTPQVVWKNVSGGGAIVDPATARHLYELEQSGQAGWFNFFPGVRSKPIAVLGLLLFMFIIFGSIGMFLFGRQ